MASSIKHRPLWLTLVLLSPLVSGCVPLSVKKQCDLVYQGSKAYDSYEQDADKISITAIEKHVGQIKPLDDKDPRPVEVKVAETMAKIAKIQEKTVEIAEETAIGHQAFAKTMTAQAKNMKGIRASDSQVKNWQETMVTFYEQRGEYHNKMALFYKRAKRIHVEKKEVSDADKKSLESLKQLGKQIKDRSRNNAINQLYRDFQSGCKIGPGVKIQSNGYGTRIE
jgi:hypothetical protein